MESKYRTKIFSIRLTADEMQKVSEYTKHNRGEISTYIRKRLLWYVDKQNSLKSKQND